ncbi:Predicted lipoprotein with conserved Yx(FWY)xxD motif [Lentzea albida]|uniref:Predicted lipoprotein with conserved Yx(FWY)xxD motif n=2 Tax=Lentzea albida TaxID=65499 RepID=A0A1H9LAG1_9PSEU|nr:Predicted lipoprotein with conserved Yx(FWY)xxD motif [Lentzea albida]
MDKEDMSVIRRNRIAIGLAAGLAVVLGLGVWSATGSGSNNSKPVAQTETDLGVLGDYGDVGQPPVLQEPAAAPETPVQQQAPETPAAQPAAQPPAAAPVSTLRLVGKSVDKMGQVVQDGDGRTLYRFDKDVPKPEGKSNCNDQCAVTWPPLLSDTIPQLEGVDQKLVSLITRADGKKQVAIDGWALYTYSKDPAPGKWAGQGIGNTWFVIQPNGKRNVECLPPGVTAPAA